MRNGHAAAGLWTGPQLQCHINCLELLAVWLALICFKMLLHERHVLVRTDNTATVAYNVVRKEIVFWNVTVQNYSDTGLNILE